MAGFDVVPDNLDAYGRLIGRIGDDMHEVQSYIYDHDHTDIGGLGGRIYRNFYPSHEATAEATHKMLDHLKIISAESVTSLNKIANHYRHTERSVAAKVDATYPEVASRLSRRDLTESRYDELTGRVLATRNFADVSDAKMALKEPESAELDAFETFEMNPSSVFDYLSPSNAALHVIQLVIHHDPLQWFMEWFAGDWKKTYEYGNVLENAGTMMGAVSTNIHRGVNELRETWMGNAADAACKYFDDLAAAVREQQELLAQLGQKYKVISMGILRMQDTALSLIKGMMDAALIGAIAASSGAATAETGVGGVAGGLIATVEAARIWEMWERAKMVPEKATQAGNGFIGFLQTATSTMTHFGQQPLPATGYRSPVS